MNLSPHFTLEEFTASEKAKSLSIDNRLPAALMTNAVSSAEMMERIRDFLSSRAGKDIPINVSSGYRCPMLNNAIGSKGKDHPNAHAWDWTAPAFGTPLQVCRAIAANVDAIGIGQLIYEGTWVHTSAKSPDKAINRVITMKDGDYVAGIVP